MSARLKVKHVFFVGCDYPFFQQNFKKSKNAEVLVFAEVRKRLTSREVSKEPPSDEIVRFHIRKRLNTFMHSPRTDFLYYWVPDIQPASAGSISHFARSNPDARIFLLVEDPAMYAGLEDHGVGVRSLSEAM